MIPKIIHYCWLSDEPFPSKISDCIESWKQLMPDYTIKRWSTKNFDIHSVPLVEQAFNAKKWAFAADYIRINALYHEGGIYLDSDVMLYGDLSKLMMGADFVSAVEYHPTIMDVELNKTLLDNKGRRITNQMKVNGIGIQAAVLASAPHHPLLKACKDYYEKISLDEILSNHYTAPTVIAYNAEPYGFVYKDVEQELSAGIHLYQTSRISNFDQKNKNSVAVHYCAGSWVKRSAWGKIAHILNRYSLYRRLRDIIKKRIV